MLGLNYDEIWALDTEFISVPGAQPVPVCLVARELVSNRLVRIWQDDLPSECPFRTDARVLFLAFFNSAEWGVFLELGWPLPERSIDLYAEFRAHTNGQWLAAGNGLLGALAYFGVRAISKGEKDHGRELVMRGGPWSPGERTEILDYCQTDVDALGPLFEHMIISLRHGNRFDQALLRGWYMCSVARMERNGIPIDTEMLEALRLKWTDIKLDLIREIDADYGVFEGTSFRQGLFAGYLARHNIAWPLTPSGLLMTDEDTFKDMCKVYPNLYPLAELKKTLGEMRLESLAVGPDGRNRAMLSPFRAVTGRNQPSNSKFIFGPSVWLRGLVKPTEGHALAYVDWSSQEVAIAAFLSGDVAMQAALMSGDPYLTFAIGAGLAPADATKETHKAVRDMAKVCVLGSQYGMGPDTLALQIGQPRAVAADLQRRLGQQFPRYAEWASDVVSHGQLTGLSVSRFGWPMHTRDSKPNAIRNFPMQANGAEMLRLACNYAFARGVKVCAPVHDALLVEGPVDEIEAVVATTQAAMGDASAAVLDGFRISNDAEVIRWPGRYADPRGAVMWERVMGLISEGQAALTPIE